MSTPASAEALSHNTHDPYLAHHFEDRQQQDESHTLGLWVFLATEIMFFGGLFLAFTVYHVVFSEAFGLASNKLAISYGVINTGVLLLSSFTMAMSVYSAQTGQKKKIIAYLAVTLLCACTFMGIKYVEWKSKFDHHLVPGPSFKFDIDDPYPAAELPADWPAKREALLAADPYIERHAQMFFVMYFCITGLHGIHVLIGMGLIGWILLRAIRGEFNERWFTPVEMVGLYWHLVDVIWIYVFPLIYLIHRH